MAIDNRDTDDSGFQQNLEQNGFIFGYAIIIERFAVLICILILFVTLGCGAVSYLLHGFPSFEDPGLGFSPRGTTLSSRTSAFFNFLRVHPDILSPVPRDWAFAPSYYGNASVPGTIMEKRQAPQIETFPEDQCPYPDVSSLKIVFESSDGGHLFDVNHLKSICGHEATLLRNHQTFLNECQMTTYKGNSKCCPIWSLGYAVAVMNNKHSCEDINEEDVRNTGTLLARCSNFTNEMQDTNEDTRENISRKCNGLVEAVFNYMVPESYLSNLKGGGDFESELPFLVSYLPLRLCKDEKCLDKIEIMFNDNFKDLEKLNDGLSKVSGLDFSLKARVFRKTLISDLFYVAIGLGVAIIIIWFYTRSVFIAMGSILNMLMSMVLAYFLYFVIFRIPFFPFINALAAILVIGIGADDTFVYIDIWRATKTKLVEKRGFYDRVSVVFETTQHAFATLFVTSLTTSAALYVSVISNITATKCFAIYSGTVIFVNFIYTITWFPCIVVIHDKYFTSKLAESSYKYCCKVLFLEFLNKVSSCSPHNIFVKVLQTLVRTFRYIWILMFIIFGLAGIILTFGYPTLQLPSSDKFQFFRKSHLFERYDQDYRGSILINKYEERLFPITFIWGVLPTLSESQWNPLEIGDINFDSEFEFGSKESQTWLQGFIKTLEKQTFFDQEPQNNRSVNFVEDVLKWINRSCDLSGDNNYYQGEKFNNCAQQYTKEFCRRSPCSSSTPGFRFDRNNTVRALYLSFNSSVSFSIHFTPVREFWETLSTWTTNELSNAPSGMQRGWSYSQIDSQLGFYDLQLSMITGTWITIGLSLVAALVVLFLTTRNILITLYAILSISFIESSLVGCLVLLGWELNVLESITFSLAIGLSVDFTIHYGVAYRLAPYKDRKARTLHAIETLSPSITVAAISTFAAGAVMIPSSVVTYAQLGEFLTIITSLSWLFATFLFLPLCMTFGPNGDCGQCLLSKRKASIMNNEVISNETVNGATNAAFNSES